MKYHPCIGFKKRDASNKAKQCQLLERSTPKYENETRLNNLLELSTKKELKALAEEREIAIKTLSHTCVNTATLDMFVKSTLNGACVRAESAERCKRMNSRVQLGYIAFNQFYKLSAGAKKDKTYEEFCKSSYYNAFVKFGSFVSNVKPLYPEKYINYVVTSGVKLDQWCQRRNV